MYLTHALKWSFLSEIASKAVQPLVFIVLARLLTPEDFGVVAAATMVISFSQIFWEAGMAKALIQYQGERSAAANVAFWINNMLGILVAGALIISADVIADKIFHDLRVASVLQVMSLQVLLSASVSVHTALLQKDMQFKHLFWVRFATVTFPGLISIPMAWHGMGYWALVSGTIAGQITQVLILWKTSHWKPSFSFDSIIAKQLIRFGGWVAATGLLGWFYSWADSLIVSLYLGPHELGLYRQGNLLTTMMYSLIFSPFMPVLYSYFSNIQQDLQLIRLLLIFVNKFISIISIPLGFMIYISSDRLTSIIFDENWDSIGLVVGILGFTHGFAWIVGVNPEAYRSIGRPDIETKILAISFIAYLAIYLISIKHGFESFLWGRLACVSVGLFIHMCFCSSIFTIPLTQQLWPAVKIGLLLLPAVFLSHFWTQNDFAAIPLSYPMSWVLLVSGSVLFIEKKALIKAWKINGDKLHIKNN